MNIYIYTYLLYIKQWKKSVLCTLSVFKSKLKLKKSKVKLFFSAQYIFGSDYVIGFAAWFAVRLCDWHYIFIWCARMPMEREKEQGQVRGGRQVRSSETKITLQMVSNHGAVWSPLLNPLVRLAGLILEEAKWNWPWENKGRWKVMKPSNEAMKKTKRF